MHHVTGGQRHCRGVGAADVGPGNRLHIGGRADSPQSDDLCAAPGGKTLQLADLGAKVTAVDKSEYRLRRLKKNLERCQLDAEIVEADVLNLPESWDWPITSC